MDCVFLGGYGAGLEKGQRLELDFTAEAMYIRAWPSPRNAVAQVPGVHGIGLGGVGEFQTGGGFIGGGFGFTGALQGVAMASMLNALTVRTHQEAVIAVRAADAELYFVTDKSTPQQLRIDLAQVLSRLPGGVRMNAPTDFVEPPGADSDEIADHRRESARVSADQDRAVDSVVGSIGSLVEMHRVGILTDEEFTRAKRQLLGE